MYGTIHSILHTPLWDRDLFSAKTICDLEICRR